MHKYILSIANTKATTTVQSTWFTKRKIQSSKFRFHHIHGEVIFYH